jgi:hypothetical protein
MKVFAVHAEATSTQQWAGKAALQALFNLSAPCELRNLDNV